MGTKSQFDELLKVLPEQVHQYDGHNQETDGIEMKPTSDIESFDEGDNDAEMGT